MPHLDAKALDTDPDGLEFLRAVLRPRPAAKGGREGRESRRKTRGMSPRSDEAGRPASV
jgi:hypothetical protein